MIGNRESKQFWAVTDGHQIQYVTGYRCTNDGQWWCPELGYTMTEKRHLFNEKEAAREKAMEEISENIRLGEENARLREENREMKAFTKAADETSILEFGKLFEIYGLPTNEGELRRIYSCGFHSGYHANKEANRELETTLGQAQIELSESEKDLHETQEANRELDGRCKALGEVAFELKETNRELLKDKEELLQAASDLLDYDNENQCPVCHCCGMELNDKGAGHKLSCLAYKILSQHAPAKALDKAALAKGESDKCKICGLPFHGLNYSEKCTCGT